MIRFWQRFRQANRWSQLSPSGTVPAARSDHTSVWSDVADGMYVFGGEDDSRGLSVNGLVRRNAPRHSTASLRQKVQWLPLLRPPGVGRVEFAGDVFWKNPSRGLMRSDDLTQVSELPGDIKTSAKHHVDQRVLGSPSFLFSCFIPLFGDTCRHEDSFAVHVQQDIM